MIADPHNATKPTNLKYLGSRALVFFLDSALIAFAWLGAYWLRFNLSTIPTSFWQTALQTLPYVTGLQIAVYLVFGLYRGEWRYVSLSDLLRIIKVVAIACAMILLLLWAVTRMEGIPRSVIPLYGLLVGGFWGGARFGFRAFKERTRRAPLGKRVLIVGAGQSGESLARDLLRDRFAEYVPVVFVDDNLAKIGCDMHGIRIAGLCDEIPTMVNQHHIEVIIIAIPSATSAQMRRIVSLCEITSIPFRTLPGMKDLAAGRVNINALREVSIEDLLGRDPVNLDWQKISQGVAQKNVLITGGGGSIGAEICRQVAKLQPQSLLVMDNSEFNLYTIQMEVNALYPALDFHCFLVDITDAKAVEKIMLQQKPEVVFHAAAYKHVPLLESQLRAGVKNNILGTYVMASAASTHGVKQFVLISTDKVVNSANVLGATKRVAEIFCQNFDRESKTQFITVRFGNVLGSAGSVLPLFQKQLAAGGPLTVTHPDVSRYFMTIPEAVQLILQATMMSQGGEIFVLDMGEPVKIRYLAEQMIRLSGRTPGEDIGIVYTGLRAGETLHESLFCAGEILVKTAHEKILKAQSREVAWPRLVDTMEDILRACDNVDEVRLIELLRQLVPEYRSSLNEDKRPPLRPLENPSIYAAEKV